MGFAFLLQPNVGTYLGASASEEQSMRCPVVYTRTTHKPRAPQPHPTCRDARSSVRKRRAIYEGPSCKRHKGGWHINVGTYLGASAIGEAPSRGPVVCTHTTHKYRAPQPHPTSRDARSSVRKRRAINEGHSFKRHKGGWHINVGTYLGASASGGAPSRGRSPTCQSINYF